MHHLIVSRNPDLFQEGAGRKGPSFPREERMRTANLVSGVALVAFGLLMTFVVIPMQIEEGPPGMVSPRLVPQIMLWMISETRINNSVNAGVGLKKLG